MNVNVSPAKRRRAIARTRDFVLFMRGGVNEFLTDNCPHLAASISYYVLLCLFPLTLAAVSIVGFLSHDEGVQTDVIDAIKNFLPPMDQAYIEETIDSLSRNWVGTGALATALLLWGGMALFSAIRKSLNTAWGIRTPRPFLVERVMEVGMLLGVGLLLVASFGLTTGVSVAGRMSDEAIGGFFGGAIFWGAVRILITSGLAFVTFLVLYKIIPNTRVRWSDVWGGALLAAVGFEASKNIFVWYAAEHSDYRALYGPVIGAVIAMMVFVYVSAIIFLFCAKLTAVYSRQRVFTSRGKAWRTRRRIVNRGEPRLEPRTYGERGFVEPGNLPMADPEGDREPPLHGRK